MKNLIISIAICSAGLLMASTAVAQITATANASATLVTPITITNASDMNFGNIANNGAIGTVTLAPDGSRTVTGDASLPATTGTVTAASFNLTGADAYTYAITLPASVDITNGTDIMTVDTFICTPVSAGTSGTTGTITGGTDVINIGANLNITAGLSAGAYTSAAAFSVTVAYN